MSAILEVQGLTKRFGGLTACADISLAVAPGELVAIIGPNGAGKTTLFSCIAAEQHATSGRVLFDGTPLRRRSQAAVARMGIGRTYQIMRPFLSLTTAENVMVGPLERGRSLREARAVADAVLEDVRLTPSADLPATALSTGQRKRLELARVLAREPRLLLLDEITGGVDRKNLPDVLHAVRRARRPDRGIVMIEHNMRAVRALADRVVAIVDGRVVVEGPPEVVLEDTAVVRAYLGSSYRPRESGEGDAGA